jgi:hypothetical protein
MEDRNPLTKTSTLTRTSSLGLIWGIAEWTDGTIVLSDAERHTICNLVLPNSVNVIAGTGSAGCLDGVGEKAMFNTPKGITLTEEAEVLVADSSNHKIRQVSSSGYVTTLSGTGKRGSLDGPSKTATWDLPVEIAHISAGPNESRILVASFNSPYLRCIHNGHVTTLTSPGVSTSSLNSSSEGLSARVARSSLNTSQKRLPADLASPIFSFVREVGSAHLGSVISKLEQRLAAGTLAFNDGPLNEACFKSINALISNHRGDLIVMDCGNHAIRLITIEGKVTTISGCGMAGHLDGVGSHTRLSFPRTMILTKQAEILIADTGNACLRRIELASSLKPHWLVHSQKARHFNHLLPNQLHSPPNSASSQQLTSSEESPEDLHEPTPAPLWSDLVWGTSNAGTWRLHRCLLFSRCPSLTDAAVQSKFLDLKVSVQAYAAFWEFVYNDVFPVFKADLSTTSVLVELVAIFQCVRHVTAFEYAAWILAHSIDALQTVEEIIAIVPLLVNLQLTESLKTAIRILARRTDNPKTEDAMRQVHSMVSVLDDTDFQAWMKRRSSMSSSFSRKISEKSPAMPFGTMERDLGTLLIRDETSGRIHFPDLALKVAVDQLSCHRAILYQKWPLITSQIEASSMDQIPLVITLPPELSDMRISSLYGLLCYFYTGSLDMLKEADECTDLARIYDHLQIDDSKLKSHIFQNGFVDLASTGPNLWIQPAEPPASSCSIQ